MKQRHQYNADTVSESIRKRNPDLFGVRSAQTNKHGERSNSLGENAQTQKSPKTGDRGRVVIVATLCAHSLKTYDGDNLQNALKPARDEIAKFYGFDDGDNIWSWQYAQTITTGTPGFTVTIELLNK